MENKFAEYNASLIDGTIDTYQGSFKVDESKGKVGRIRDFNEGIKVAIGLLYTGIRKGSVKVSPIDEEQFQGMKKDSQYNFDLEFDYSVERVATFPYRVGVLTWKVGHTRFYKLGVKVLNASVK